LSVAFANKTSPLFFSNFVIRRWLENHRFANLRMCLAAEPRFIPVARWSSAQINKRRNRRENRGLAVVLHLLFVANESH